MFGRSHERIRQLLAKYGGPQPTLLPENTVAAKLGYPLWWLIWLRKEGIINPIRPGGYWLYSEEQVRQIPSLIARARKCEVYPVGTFIEKLRAGGAGRKSGCLQPTLAQMEPAVRFELTTGGLRNRCSTPELHWR